MHKLIEAIPQSLLESIKEHRCIPFVGSGLSLPFGLPTWELIIDRMVDRCRKEKKPNPEVIESLKNDGDYSQAAQKALDKLGKQIYRDEMEKLFVNYDKKQDKTLQKLIWELDPPMVMTTNFDTLLEDAIDPRPDVVTPLHESKLYDIFRKPITKTLFKIHGSIDIFESIVFSEEDYKKLYQEEMQAFYLAFIKPVLSNTLLFIGFGMKDPGVLKVLQKVSDIFDNFSGTHYALVLRNDVSVTSFWKNYKITIIEYDDHRDVEVLLRDLKDIIHKMVKEEPVPPSSDRKPSKNSYNHTIQRVSIQPSDKIPYEMSVIRHRSIGGCIFLLSGVSRGRAEGWDEHKLIIDTKFTYYNPTGILKDIQMEAQARYERLGYLSTPRFSLMEVHTEPIDNFRFGDITITTEIADWALIDGIQTVLENRESPSCLEIDGLFWKSISSLLGEGRSCNFPHHLAVHCLIVSKDNKIILNKRVGVSNQRGKISASFEEQMQFPYSYPGFRGRSPRFFNGDPSPIDTVIRGAKEELGIQLQRKDIVILALCMESSSIAANLIAFSRSSLTADEIYTSWKKAEDKGENLMIPPDSSPEWNIELLLPLLTEETVLNEIPGYGGPWHASSRARIILGLIKEFSVESVAKYIDLDFLYAC